MNGTQQRTKWSLLTPHGHVLARISLRPDVRIRELAAGIRLTERAVHRIVSDLETAGLVSRTKVGRRNHYDVHLEQTIHNDLENRLDLEQVVAIVAESLES